MPKVVEEERDEHGNVTVEVDGEKVTVQDPGALEGVKKDPRKEQDKLTPDHPRFREVYKDREELKRRVEVLEKKQEGSISPEVLEEMRRHNQSLEKTIEELRGSRASDDNANDLKGLEDKLGELRNMKREAREQANFDRETEIDDKITDLKVDIREIKRQIEKDKDAAAKPPDTKDKEGKLSDEDQEIFDEWVKENPWFTKSPKRRKYATKVEKEIIKEPEFELAEFDEILEEVAKRVEDKFKPVKGRNTVEDGGGRHASGSTPAGTVKLSPTEVEIAKGLGISPEKYAKQKSITGDGGMRLRRDGE
jgi:hypothetical protein